MKKMSKLNSIKMLLIAFASAALLGGCNETADRSDYLPYLVTKVGKQVELRYIGEDDIIPLVHYTITHGEYAVNSNRCNLRSTKVQGANRDGYAPCDRFSDVKLGNVLTIRIDHLKGDNQIKYPNLSCRKCGNINTERLASASSIAHANTEIGTVSQRIDGVETAIKFIDKKVDENMDMTVAAVKKVHRLTKGNAEDIDAIGNQVMKHKKVIDEAQREMAYEEPKRNGVSLPSDNTGLTLEHSTDNRFDFLGE